MSMRRLKTFSGWSWAPTSEDSSKLTRQPSDLKQLNGSVWEFFRPPPDSDGVPKLEILFFHGAQLSPGTEAFWKTWLSRDETVVWPMVWLAQKFPEARMLFVSYDSSIQRSSGQKDTYQTIENLMHDIIWSSTCSAGQKCPMIFVGHSFGGIIIKEFLIRCSEYPATNHSEDLDVQKLRVFLQHCRAIFYYSTPNAGSRLMDGLAYRDFILGNVNESMVHFLKVLSKDTARINNEFSNLRRIQKWQTRGIVETLETNLIDSTKTMVVPEASARRDLDRIYWAPDADHFHASRAKDNFSCSIFIELSDLVRDYYEIPSSSIRADSKLKSALLTSNDERLILRNSRSAYPLPFGRDAKYVPIKGTFDKVRRALEGEHECHVVTVCGEPGLGKTSLAKYVALHYWPHRGPHGSEEGSSSAFFPDGVIFLHCGKGAVHRIKQLAHHLLQILDCASEDVPEECDGDHVAMPTFRRRFQSKLRDWKALIVLDDVWERPVLEELILSLDEAGSVKYLLTSRIVDVWPDAVKIIMEWPTSTEAKQILLKYTSGLCTETRFPKDIDGIADSIVRLADFHPLTLANVGLGFREQDGQDYQAWRAVRDAWLHEPPIGQSYEPGEIYGRSYHIEFSDETKQDQQSSKATLGSQPCSRSLRADVQLLGFTDFNQKFDEHHVLILYDVRASENCLDMLVFHDEGMAKLIGVGLPYCRMSIIQDVELKIMVHELSEGSWKEFWEISDENYFQSFQPIVLECKPLQSSSAFKISMDEAISKFGIGIKGVEEHEFIGVKMERDNRTDHLQWWPAWIETLLSDYKQRFCSDVNDLNKGGQHCNVDTSQNHLMEGDTAKDGGLSSPFFQMFASASGGGSGSSRQQSWRQSENEHQSGSAPSSQDSPSRGEANGGNDGELPSDHDHPNVGSSSSTPGKIFGSGGRLVVEIYFNNRSHVRKLDAEGKWMREVDHASAEGLQHKAGSLILPMIEIEFFYNEEGNWKMIDMRFKVEFQKRAQQDLVEKRCHSGWYHDNLSILFGCEEGNGALLEPASSKIISEIEYTSVESMENSENSDSQTLGSSSGWSGQIKAGVRFPALFKVLGLGGFRRDTTRGKTKGSKTVEQFMRKAGELTTLKGAPDFAISNKNFGDRMEYEASLFDRKTKSYQLCEMYHRGMFSTVTIDVAARWIIVDEGNKRHRFNSQKTLKFYDDGQSSANDSSKECFRQITSRDFIINHSFSHMEFSKYQQKDKYKWMWHVRCPVSDVLNHPISW